MDGHISFSEFKDFNFCSHYHKLVWIQGLREYNVYAFFGTAVHAALEEGLSKNSRDYDVLGKVFLEKFEKECGNKVILERHLAEVPVMKTLGPSLVRETMEYLDKTYPGFKLIGSEKSLFCKGLLPHDYAFKGFVDLILEDSQGKQHIIDFKTATFWDARKRSEPMTIYQLILYKNFLIQEGIVNDDCEVTFLLLKRTAKEGKRIEPVKVTSGKKRISNAMLMLENTVKQIHSGKTFKNRLNCQGCRFNKTEWCK